MTSNSKFHLQSLFFAVIILMFAIFSSGGSKPESVAQIPRESQLTATVVDATGQTQQPVEPVIHVQNGGDKIEFIASNEAVAVESQPAPSTQVVAPNVVAAAFLAKEFDAEKSIGGYQADYRWPIASITKLMTALVALEKIGPDQEVIMSQEAIDTEGDSGFTAGETFTVSDLIVAMMTVSSNDAAAALADYIGTPHFFDLMQEKAYELKMSDTSFIDATGLSYLNQSTADDVAVLIGYIYRTYPEILEPSAHLTNKIVERGSKMSRTLRNINTFAGTTGFMGGKTGFTDESKGNLVSLFSYQGKTYTLIVFGTVDRFAETRKLLTWLKETLKQPVQ